MLMAIVIAKALLEVAGLALLGQGLLYLLTGANREQNIFYRTLKTIAMPATKFTRLITPKFVADAHIGFAAFFLVVGLWLGVLIEYRNQCQLNPQHSACAELVDKGVVGAPEAPAIRP